VDLTRLLNPSSVAIVGASTRLGTYGNQTVANLVAAGFQGPVWGVHPSADEVHGVRCVRTLADLPVTPDVVIIATPAASVPDLVDQAGQVGAGGVVTYAAGFAESANGRALQQQLVDVALKHQLPVCGPNGNGLILLHQRAPLWGDAYRLGPAGPVAVISQSGNIAVNALGTRRGLGLHTVVSCGNQAVLDAADYLVAIAEQDHVRSIALYLETDPDGRRLTEGLATCAERGIGVVVLKSGRTSAGASAAAAHTGAVASDARVLEALVREAGGAWVTDPHELLDVAKALSIGRRLTGGVAIFTCSGGDAAISADLTQDLGIELPPLQPETVAALEPIVPSAATIGNPLDYTALMWGEIEPVADIFVTAAADPGLAQIVGYYDEPQHMDEQSSLEWRQALESIAVGAERTDKSVIIASTLPDTLPEDALVALAERGIPAVWGIRTGLLAADALRRPFPAPGRLRAIAAITRSDADADAGEWLAEHDAKALLAGCGVPVPAGGSVDSVDEAVFAADRLGYPVALKLSAADLQHKSDIGALALNLVDADAVRSEAQRLLTLRETRDTLLVEQMADPGVELIVAAHRDGVVPVLVVGLGGIWVEVADDAAILPLPTTPDAVIDALRRLRGASLLTGGRGRSSVDLTKVAQLACAVGAALISEDLALVELNPVIAGPHAAIAADAVVRRLA
jgi:acyl-CoA synthetase (NDP forming)